MNKSDIVERLLDAKFPFHALIFGRQVINPDMNIDSEIISRANDVTSNSIERMWSLTDDFHSATRAHNIGDLSDETIILCYVKDYDNTIDFLEQADGRRIVELYARYENSLHEPANELTDRDYYVFFSNPRSPVDIQYWMSFPSWTVDEAVHIIHGKDPRYVPSGDHIRFYALRYSPFALSVQKSREITKRALQVNELREPIDPVSFLQWAESQTLADASSIFELALQNKRPDPYQIILERNRELSKECSELRARLTEYGELDSKTSSSYLKIIIGLSKERYNIRKGRVLPISKIMSDLHLSGIKIDENTVRKHLEEARRLVEGDE